MKIKVILLFSLTIFLTSCGVSSSTARSDRKESKKEKNAAEFEKTSALIDSGNFLYSVQSVNSSSGKTIRVSSTYTMKAKEGTYQAYLPYFGRAYRASYGGDGGINFEGEPENLTIARDPDKGSVTVKFIMKEEDDRFEVTLVVSSAGYGNMSVISQNRATISYYGSISELTD